MKLLITGGTGQVGFELKRQFSLFGEVLAPQRNELDLASPSAVEAYLDTHRPSLILNAAAYTAVDNAEQEPELANRLNARLPAQLAAYSAAQGQWLVHYSSDYVYPGSGNTPWQEQDTAGPLSVYGQSKRQGDQAIQASGCHHLIFRTSWVYSARGNNFMKTMLRLGRERDALKVVSDQIGAPTPARLIAQVSAQAMGVIMSSSQPTPCSGVYHLAPSGETSWHGFASEIFRLAAEQGEPLMISPEQVAPIPTHEYPTPAARPLNSRLCCERLEQALKVSLPSWQHQLSLTLEEHLDR